MSSKIADEVKAEMAKLLDEIGATRSLEVSELSLEAAYLLGKRRGLTDGADLTKRMLGIETPSRSESEGG